jgi:hypothetical protein
VKTGILGRHVWLNSKTKTAHEATIEHTGKNIRAVTPAGAIYEGDTPEEVMDLIGGVFR